MAQPLEAVAPPAPLLLGDEAVALAALHAGITSAYAYPGTPSTEILETIRLRGREDGVTAQWTANEKTSYEQALGVSMMGCRVLVSMKHVGLNVAMDAFVNSALLGIRGGLVLAVADDPGMHSSQNEQDSRRLAEFADVPVLEPGTPQEAYEMTREAFDLSERFGTPVMVRLVTRLCHGRGPVRSGPPRPSAAPTKPGSPADWVLLPANARRLWRHHLESAPEVEAWSARSRWNSLGTGAGTTGIVTTGVARSYVEEFAAELEPMPPHLHLAAYPLPRELLRRFAAGVERIVVLEEGHPLVEGQLAGLLPNEWRVEGRRSSLLPPDGELTPELVRSALGLPERPRLIEPHEDLPGRPPQLCRGCPHRDAYAALERALQSFGTSLVTGDIGCYTLGALPPVRAIESCVCMGASIGMAKGAADAGMRPVLAVIGDSTFLHSGVTGLMDAAAHDTPMTVFILDNETVGMTGQQPTVLPDSRLLPLVKGVGVDPEHVHLVEAHPTKVEALAAILRRELEHPGLSVVIGVRECIVAARHRKARERAGGEETGTPGQGGGA
jgi:indolepyruvate ferredoxin oxidoreductase alpha subunit